MGTFDQFANQGGAAAWDPNESAEAKRLAEEQLRNADYAGDLPEPLGSTDDGSTVNIGETSSGKTGSDATDSDATGRHAGAFSDDAHDHDAQDDTTAR